MIILSPIVRLWASSVSTIAICSLMLTGVIPKLNEEMVIIFEPTVSFKSLLFKNRSSLTMKLPLVTRSFKLFWLFVVSNTKPVAIGVLIPSVSDIILPAVYEEFCPKTKLITLIVDSINLFDSNVPLTFLKTNWVEFTTLPINIPEAPVEGCVIVSPSK